MTSVTNLTHNVIHTSAVHHFQLQLCLKGKVGFKEEFSVGCESCFSLLSFLTPGFPGINTQTQTCWKHFPEQPQTAPSAQRATTSTGRMHNEVWRQKWYKSRANTERLLAIWGLIWKENKISEMFCKRLSPRHRDLPNTAQQSSLTTGQWIKKKEKKKKSSSSFWLYLCSSYRNSRYPTPDDAETRVLAQKKDNKCAPPGCELWIVWGW